MNDPAYRRDSFQVLVEGVGSGLLEGSVLITGFQGFGGVGYITTRYVASKVKAKKIGYILTKHMPDVVFSDEGRLGLPYEIYYFERNESKFLILLNHVVPMRERVTLCRGIVEWSKKVGVKELVLIGGLDINAKVGSGNYRILKNSHYRGSVEGDVLEPNLYIIGPLALLALYSEIYGVPALIILPYTEPARISPGSAAIAVEVLNKIYKLNVDPEELYLDAKALEEEYERLSELQKLAERESKKPTHYM